MDADFIRLRKVKHAISGIELVAHYRTAERRRNVTYRTSLRCTIQALAFLIVQLARSFWRM
jgi:hypothetical protein